MINFYKSIKVTKGYSCSNIVDLGRKCFYQLSNNLLNIIFNKPEELTEGVIAFLNDNELINPFEEEKSFIPINLNVENFNNKIIDTLFVKYIPNHLLWFNFNFFKTFRLDFHIIVKIEASIFIADFENLISSCNEILAKCAVNTIQIIFEDILFEINHIKFDERIVLIKERVYPLIKSELDFYGESLHRHTYFNHNAFINSKGEIKNSFDSKVIFGDIYKLVNFLEIINVMEQPKFQEYWFVHKELCDVCKDCEFRNMCIDNRLPYKRKDGSWYHKTECNYNPYICKWEHEDGCQRLKECEVISDEHGFSINHEKITAINKMLWEEEEPEND